jgi:hypothetical protein
MSQSEASLPPCLAGYLTDEDIAAMMPRRVFPEREFWDVSAIRELEDRPPLTPKEPT